MKLYSITLFGDYNSQLVNESRILSDDCRSKLNKWVTFLWLKYPPVIETRTW